MTTRIQLRRGTASQWSTVNPTLSQGEVGFETDTGKFKIGSGSTAWSGLDYFLDSSDLSIYLTQASASTTYLTQASASTTYLTQASASTTYLTQASASTTYQTKTGAVDNATTSTATSGIGYMGLPQNSTTTGAYGIVAADAGKHIYSTATRTVTLPANGTIAMPIGTTIVFIAASGATVTIAITTDTLLLAGAGTTGSRSLAPHGMATCVKITPTSWIISGNGLT